MRAERSQTRRSSAPKQDVRRRPNKTFVGAQTRRSSAPKQDVRRRPNKTFVGASAGVFGPPAQSFAERRARRTLRLLRSRATRMEQASGYQAACRSLTDVRAVR